MTLRSSSHNISMHSKKYGATRRSLSGLTTWEEPETLNEVGIDAKRAGRLEQGMPTAWQIRVNKKRSNSYHEYALQSLDVRYRQSPYDLLASDSAMECSEITEDRRRIGRNPTPGAASLYLHAAQADLRQAR